MEEEFFFPTSIDSLLMGQGQEVHLLKYFGLLLFRIDLESDLLPQFPEALFHFRFAFAAHICIFFDTPRTSFPPYADEWQASKFPIISNSRSLPKMCLPTIWFRSNHESDLHPPIPRMTYLVYFTYWLRITIVVPPLSPSCVWRVERPVAFCLICELTLIIIFFSFFT